MCWLILYHESKMTMDKIIPDYNIYKKVNVLENINYIFQVNKIDIQNKLYYNITHNQCACDFFNNIKLQKEFMSFVFNRMEIPCIEPYILIKWLDNVEIKTIPENITNINKNNLLSIFTDEYKEIFYCIKRNE